MPVRDLKELPDGQTFEFDLCLVGAGVAGITIALEFAGTAIRVCVVDSGGLELSTAAEALSEIESVGLKRAPQNVTRRRGLGGSSALWTGRCGIFDAMDYQRRSWVPGSGWPIDENDVAPYVERAGNRLGLGPAMYSEAAWRVLAGRDEMPWDLESLQPVVYQFSQHAHALGAPVRAYASGPSAEGGNIGFLQHAGAPKARHLGEAFLQTLRESANIEVLLNAHATEVETDASGTRVTSVRVAAHDGRHARINAARIVLCCGGIDNARLLLASRSTCPQGLGNDRDQVGRYLSDHPVTEVAVYDGRGDAALRRRLGSRWFDRNGSRHVYSLGMRLSPEVQRTQGLLNAALHMLELGSEDSAVASAGNALRALKRRQLDGSVLANGARALRQPLALAQGVTDRYVKRRPALSPAERVSLLCVVEQLPNPDSRVMLSSQLDAFGRPLAKIDWRASDAEYETAKAFSKLLMRELRRLGCELPQVPAWLAEGPDAFRAQIHDMAHPMGSTRMSDDPAQGVVDRHAKVHGVEGLYVAGGSTFTTGGYMNPTLMITSLSLRLADHLKQALQDRAHRHTKKAADTEAAPRPLRVGIVGWDDRLRDVHLPVLARLADRFEIVGRCAGPATVEGRGAEIAVHADVQTLAAQARPELLLVVTQADRVDAQLASLIELQIPLLLETPVTWQLRRGRAVAKRIAALGLAVGAIEPAPFRPAEQLKRRLIDRGLLGHIVSASNDFAEYDYHGVAAARAYLGGSRRPARASGMQHELVRTRPGDGPEGLAGWGARRSEDWLVGHVRYACGALLSHQFSGAYFDSPTRGPKAFRVHGSRGSIVGDAVMLARDDGSTQTSTIERQLRNGTLQQLQVDTPLGSLTWQNPWCEHPFDDEQIAVATLLEGMRQSALHGALPLYRFSDALEDFELLSAMQHSALRDGRSAGLPLNVVAQKLTRASRALVQRRADRAVSG